MRTTAAFALVLLLLLVAACGGSDDSSTEGAATDVTPTEPTATTSTATDAAGGGDLQTFEVESAGFSLGVPTSWKGISGDDFTKSGALEEFGKENPALAPYVSELQSGNSPMKLLAADPELVGNFATNVNVLVQENVPEGTSAKDYADLNRSGLSQSLDIEGTIESEEVDHEVGDAAVARYSANLNSGGQKKTFSFVQYYFVNGTDAYVVTYTTLPEVEDRYEDDFEASAASFRFL